MLYQTPTVVQYGKPDYQGEQAGSSNIPDGCRILILLVFGLWKKALQIDAVRKIDLANSRAKLRPLSRMPTMHRVVRSLGWPR